MHVWPALLSFPYAIDAARERGSLVDDCRRLAAELEGHWHEVRAAARMTACRRRTASEHKVVERERGEGLADVDAARHDRDLVLRKVLPQHPTISSDVFGANSEGSSIARLPAAIAVASGIRQRLAG